MSETTLAWSGRHCFVNEPERWSYELLRARFGMKGARSNVLEIIAV